MKDLPPDLTRPTRFLTVTGVLRPDGRLFLHPGFVTEDPLTSIAEAADSPLEAELLNAEGEVVLRSPVPVGAFIEELATSLSAGPPIRPMPDLAVAGVVPFPEATHRIRFLLRGVAIHALDVSDRAPQIEAAWELPAAPEGVHRLRWSASAADGRALSFVVAYSNDAGTTWQPLSLPSPESELDVDFAQLPGGRGRFRIMATDGTRTASADSPVLRLARRPVIPTIFEPPDGAELPGKGPILLHGEGYDLEERRSELENLSWSSSRDGALGSGAVLQVELRPGTHRITLAAGTGKRRAETSVTVRVVKPTAEG